MTRTTLWLGAHKTGTTFLQHGLDLSTEALAAAGIDYMPLDTFRNRYTRPLFSGQGVLEDSHYLGANIAHALIFDENILGLVQHVPGPEGLYPEGPWRADEMMDHLGRVPTQIVLGIRGFTGFLPSLYCEKLKSTAYKPFRAFAVTPLEQLSWANLIGRLKVTFPGVPILVYAHEELRGREARLLARVTGLDETAFTLQKGEERPGFSHETITRLDALARSRPVTQADLRALIRRFPKSPEHRSYAPWSETEAQALAARYTEDLAEIQSLPGIRFLDLTR